MSAGEGTLTRHFGGALVDELGERFAAVDSSFDAERFAAAVGDLTGVPLMARIARIADGLAAVLPPGPDDAWEALRAVLPPPLGPADKTFNDGYWMLPLAEFWSRHHLDAPVVALPALAELTQRGTAEFAIRPFVESDPGGIRATIERWTRHASFHVRRLASEGTRVNLPWKGRLRVSHDDSRAFFELIVPLCRDESRYVRRSVGNHARDLRRINPEAVDRWLRDARPPADVARLAAPRNATGRAG